MALFRSGWPGLLLAACGLLAGPVAPLRATTLPPELKAYDFAEGYRLAPDGIVVQPYHHGFASGSARRVDGGLLLRPGDTFTQYHDERLTCSAFTFVRREGDRAFFREETYRYTMAGPRHHQRRVRGPLLDTDTFYLTRFRLLEPFDQVFPEIELHPGDQMWRTR